MKKLLIVLVVTLAFLASPAVAEDPYDLAWTRQLGTPDDDYSYSVAVDAPGNVFISGRTWGSLDGVNAGSYDAFVSKYDTLGSLLWTRQLGTSGWDQAEGVATDAAGNIFISGATYGDLDGANAGNDDAFVSKYDTLGSLLWTRQLGTSDGDTSLGGVATDAAGNIFISGATYGDLDGANAGGADTFLSKYDTLGTLLWTRQLGTSDDEYSRGVATDAAGNIFISGETYGDLGGPNTGGCDAFVAKFVVPEPGTLGH